jgi:hypothetical protein
MTMMEHERNIQRHARDSRAIGVVIMDDGPMARAFWRLLDVLDYWVMQTRLWVVDVLHGPEPETMPEDRP